MEAKKPNWCLSLPVVNPNITYAFNWLTESSLFLYVVVSNMKHIVLSIHPLCTACNNIFQSWGVNESYYTRGHIFYSLTLLHFGDQSVWIFQKQHFRETSQTEKFGSFVGVLSDLINHLSCPNMIFKGWRKVVKVDTSPPPLPPPPPPPPLPLLEHLRSPV